MRYPPGNEWHTVWHTEKQNAPEGAFLLGFWRSRRHPLSGSSKFQSIPCSHSFLAATQFLCIFIYIRGLEVPGHPPKIGLLDGIQNRGCL